MKKNREKELYAILHDGIVKRSNAKMLEAEVEVIKKSANEIIQPALMELGIDKYKEEGVGALFLKTTERSTLDRQKLIEALLLRGVDPTVVKDALAEAAKTTTSTYVEFRAK